MCTRLKSHVYKLFLRSIKNVKLVLQGKIRTKQEKYCQQKFKMSEIRWTKWVTTKNGNDMHHKRNTQKTRKA